VCICAYIQAQDKNIPVVFSSSNGREHGYKLGDKIILEAKYDGAKPFQKVYSVMDKKDIWYAQVKMLDKCQGINRSVDCYGIIDIKGNIIVPHNYNEEFQCINGFFISYHGSNNGGCDNYFVIFNPKGKKIFETKGNVTIGGAYEQLVFTNNLVAIDKAERDDENGKLIKGNLGFIDFEGNTIIPFIYDSATSYDLGMMSVIFPYAHNRIVVSKNKKWGVIDFKGNIIHPFTIENVIAPQGPHKSIEIGKDGTVKMLLNNGKKMLINPKGKVTYTK
jgi:hypothetical protein